MNATAEHLANRADNAAQQEQAVLAIVASGLRNARRNRTTGKLVYEFDVQDGGVTATWENVRSKVK